MAGYNDYGYLNSDPRHTFSYIQGPLLALLSKDKNRHILDLGCGNGYLVNHLVSLGYDAYGTDASADGIAIAKQYHPDRFFVQDLSTDQLPEQLQAISFDTIVSTEVIEHLYDPKGFIEFCKRNLQAGGELVISTPYHGFFKNLMLSLFDKWDDHFDPLWRGGHIKFWSRRTLSRLLAKEGFKVTGFEGCGRIPYFWKSMIIKAKLD